MRSGGSAPNRPMAKTETEQNKPCAMGKALGAILVKFCEPGIAELEAAGEPDERCKSCAFRLGTFPNGCLTTVQDAIKSVAEPKLFQCHQTDRKGKPCHGWYASRVARRVAGIADAVCPWPYSDQSVDD